MFEAVETSSAFLETYLPYVLRRADQTLSAPFYSVLTSYGIARSEWRVLAVLDTFESLSVVELAHESLSPQPTVTHAVRRLERRGLIQRVASAADKRRRLISITQTGADLTASLMVEAKRLEGQAIEHAGDLSDLLMQLKVLTLHIEENRNNQTSGTKAG